MGKTKMKLTLLPLLASVEAACGPRLNVVEKREYRHTFTVGRYRDAAKWETDPNVIYQKNMLLGQWRTIFTQIAASNDSIQYDDGDVSVADTRTADCVPDECQFIKLEVKVTYSICRDLEVGNALNALLPFFCLQIHSSCLFLNNKQQLLNRFYIIHVIYI